MKRYLSIINLLLVTGLVYLSVDTFYNIILLRLDMIPASNKTVGRKVITEDNKQPPLKYYQPITERNLFRIEAEGSAPPPQKKQLPIENLKQTELKLKLWGTVTGNNGNAYAVIEDAKKREQNLFREGDTIQNAAVKMVLREKVVLSVNGKDEILEMEKMESGRPAQRPQRARAAARSPSTQKIVLKKADLTEALQDVNALMKQARFRPHFRNGKPDGLLLTGIRPNSLFRKMGLRNGDIIMGVDEQDIKSVDDALTFYQGLKSSSATKLQIKRRGRSRTMEYTIQ